MEKEKKDIRRCELCNSPLSKLNKGKQCFRHSFPGNVKRTIFLYEIPGKEDIALKTQLAEQGIIEEPFRG